MKKSRKIEKCMKVDYYVTRQSYLQKQEAKSFNAWICITVKPI